MNLIIPMAGMGTRMRPHTLTVPKPLFKIAGKSIVERLIEETSSSVNNSFDSIVFIIGNFGAEIEKSLLSIAEIYHSKGHIVYQNSPLGTAHAVQCAKDFLSGPVIVAFADTLFSATITIKESDVSKIWVKEVNDPSSFGVVVLNKLGTIDRFVEKPTEPISNLAIIGIYYFNDGSTLKNAIQYLLDNDINKAGEYQLTDALELMKSKQEVFKVEVVDQWMDCGNVQATLATNKQILTSNKFKNKSFTNHNSLVIEPVYLGENVQLSNSIIGPNVSIEDGSIISNSIISNSIIKDNTSITDTVIADSCIGSQAVVKAKCLNLDIGDYSKLCE